jgi:3-isopropylmalate/(R)-2-methylmalate dehydratase small subunit
MTITPIRSLAAGRGIPIRENDIDTDRIIPARYMKGITFEGLGEFAFHDARFDEAGNPKAHPFDDPRFKGGSILVVNRNFGCGSSREHAPQALEKFGIRAIVGESFAEIFAGNCTVMGLPAVSASGPDVAALQDLIEAKPETEIRVDLEAMRVGAGNLDFGISMKDSYRNALVSGTWDSTAALLSNLDAIRAVASALPYIGGFA